MCVHMHVCTVCALVLVHVHMYMCACVFACVCVYICTYVLGDGVGTQETVLITWKTGALHIWKGPSLNLSSITYYHLPGLYFGSPPPGAILA